METKSSPRSSASTAWSISSRALRSSPISFSPNRAMSSPAVVVETGRGRAGVVHRRPTTVGRTSGPALPDRPVVQTGAGAAAGVRADAGVAVVALDRNDRRRRLLLTTNTLEKAMAAPASMGLSRPRAARGMAATL